MTYHKPTAEVALGSSQSGRSPTLSASRRSMLASISFEQGVQLIGHCLLKSVPQLSREERNTLKDVARGRYKERALQRVIALAQRSARIEHRAMVAEFMRWHCRPAQLAALEVSAAFDLETQAQATADPAQREFERFPTSASYERVVEALTVQRAETERSLDAVHAAWAKRVTQ